MKSKRCKRCKRRKPVSSFRTQTATKGTECVGRVYITGTCISCDNDRRKEHYRNEREAVRWAWIERRYGLTRAQWESMFEGQGRKCACCSRTDPGSVNGWQVDHDHALHIVRGIICAHCNRLLGAAEDSIDNLKAAIGYLERPRPNAPTVPNNKYATPPKRVSKRRMERGAC